MAADLLRVTYVKDFFAAVHEILEAPPPNSASNLWHLGRVVFVCVDTYVRGPPYCSLLRAVRTGGTGQLASGAPRTVRPWYTHQPVGRHQALGCGGHKDEGCTTQVFVDLKGRDLGRPRAEAPDCSLELITVMVPSLQQAFVFDVSALANRAPGELVCLAVLFMCPGLCKVFYDCRFDADALRVLLTPANAFFRIRNIVDVSAAVLLFKLLDEGTAFYALHTCSVETAFKDYAPSAAFCLAFKTDDPPSWELEPTLEIGLRDFKSRMQSRMNPSREIWTSRPLPAEVLMYSAVNPLMCMVVFMQLRDLWLGGSSPNAQLDASLLPSRMAKVADGSEFLRDTYAVHNLPYTTDARVPNGLLDVIRGTSLSACSTFPSTFPFAPTASESVPWYTGLHLELPTVLPDRVNYYEGEHEVEHEHFPEMSSPSEAEG